MMKQLMMILSQTIWQKESSGPWDEIRQNVWREHSTAGGHRDPGTDLPACVENDSDALNLMESWRLLRLPPPFTDEEIGVQRGAATRTTLSQVFRVLAQCPLNFTLFIAMAG